MQVVAQLLANGLLAGFIYVLLAIGFAISKRETGFFDFSYALHFTLGGYLGHSLYSTGMGFIASSIMAVGITGFSGLAFQRFLFGPLARRGVTSLGLLIFSLAVYGVGQNLISILYGETRRAYRFGGSLGSVEIGPVILSRAQSIGFVLSLTALIAVAWLVLKTRFGRVFRAVADDHELAYLCGVPVQRYQVYIQGLAGALAGLAGIVFALDTGIEPRMGFPALIVAVVAVIAGGGGKIIGTAIAAILLGITQHLSVTVISSRWQESIPILVLVVVLAVRPSALAWKRG